MELAHDLVRALLHVELAHELEHLVQVDAAAAVHVGAVPLLLDVGGEDAAHGGLRRVGAEELKRADPHRADAVAARDEVHGAVVRSDSERSGLGFIVDWLELVCQDKVGGVLPEFDGDYMPDFNVVRFGGDGS